MTERGISVHPIPHYWTVKIAVAVTPFNSAEIVDVPDEMAAARPNEPIVATPESDELQVTWRLRSKLEPSVNDPTASNCWLWPTGIDALEGVIARPVRVALVTVIDVVPIWPAKTALMVVLPGASAERSPAFT